MAEQTIQIGREKFSTILDLLREAKDKIDVASGIVDWTSEDAADSGEEYFGQSVRDRIEAVLTEHKA